MSDKVVNLADYKEHNRVSDYKNELVIVGEIIAKLRKCSEGIVLFDEFMNEIKAISYTQEDVVMYYVAFLVYVFDNYIAYKNTKHDTNYVLQFYDKVVMYVAFSKTLGIVNDFCKLKPFTLFQKIWYINTLKPIIANDINDGLKDNFNTLLNNPGVAINNIVEHCKTPSGDLIERFIIELNGSVITLISLKLISLTLINPNYRDGLLQSMLGDIPKLILDALEPILPLMVFYYQPKE